jgi:hypothetical protein
MKPFLISNGFKKFNCRQKDATNNILLKLLLIVVAISVNLSCKVQRSEGSKVNVTGNWQVIISVAEGTIIGKGYLSQTGEVVTGWVGPSENDPIPVKGMFGKSNLIIKTLRQPGRTGSFRRSKAGS